LLNLSFTLMFPYLIIIKKPEKNFSGLILSTIVNNNTFYTN